MTKLKFISKKTQILLSFALSIPLLALLTFGWMRSRHPLELHHLQVEWNLYQSGVRTTHWDQWEVYVRDLNPKLPAQARYCALLIHGLGDQADTWRKLLQSSPEAWSKPLKFFAVNLPGSGNTPPPADKKNYRVRLLASELTRRLTQNTPECQDWMLIGNSLGGSIATWMAIDHPEKIRRLTLLSPGGLHAPTATPSPSSPRTHNELQFFQTPTTETLLDFQRRAYHSPRPLPPEVLRAAVQRMAQSNSRPILEAQTPEDILEPHLDSRWKIPTWIIWGESDQIIPLRTGAEWHQKLPGSFFRTLPQCGHLPQKECSTELIRILNEPLAFGVM